MKKIIALLLAMVMMFALCACGTREKENLDTATELLKEAENCIVRASTMLIDHFDVNYQSLMKYYYNVSLLEDSYFEPGDDLYDEAMEIQKYRDTAKEKMDEAKTLMGNKSSSDYYNAVKEYYVELTSFLKVITDWPEGYTYFTYMNAISSCKEKCLNAYNELAFYK